MDSNFVNHAVAGVPLLFVVLGLVEFLKQFKNKAGSQMITGNALLLASMQIGLAVGCLFMLSVTRPPAADWWAGFGYWFALVFYGLALGLVASGLYDTVKGLVTKIVVNAVIRD